MFSILILCLMIWLHIFDDFVMQPVILNKLKQKDFWKDYDEKYKNDWIAGLFIHSLSWSISIMLPLIIFSSASTLYLVLALIVNMFIHFYVDDLKANKKRINLIQDQAIHLIQILITFIIYKMYF